MWKQPIPSDINYNENLTFLERAIIREILCMCQTEDKVLHFTHANRHYEVELKRGQCIFKVSKCAKELEKDSKRIRRSIEICSKWYTELESRAMPFGLIITVKDYDNLTKLDNGMESKRKVEGKYKESSGRPNKSVKSVKSVKSGERETPTQELNKELIKEIALELKVSPKDVIAYHQKVVDHCEATGKVYENNIAMAKKWLREDMRKGKVEEVKMFI